MTQPESAKPEQSQFEILRVSDTQYAIIRKSTNISVPRGSYEVFMWDVGGKSNANFVLKALRDDEKRRRGIVGAQQPIISEVSEDSTN